MAVNIVYFSFAGAGTYHGLRQTCRRLLHEFVFRNRRIGVFNVLRLATRTTPNIATIINRGALSSRSPGIYSFQAKGINPVCVVGFGGSVGDGVF